MDRECHTLDGVLTLLADRGRGDPELEQRLDAAFRKNRRTLRTVCAKELRGFPAERVDEIVNDVLLEAWKKLPTYRRERPFRSFLFGIAVRKCSNARRKRRDLLLGDAFLEREDGQRSALGRLADAERDDLVDAAAKAVLDPQEQEVVHLRWVLDYPYDEIAGLLGLDGRNEVRTILQRCKHRMEREVVRRMVEKGLTDSFLFPAAEVR